MSQARVLVVDDDRDMLQMVRMQLARVGIHSDGASTPDEGLAKMERQMYPVAILDIHMPGMSGVDMLEALKRRNSLAQVIMLTSDASMERVIECMDRGAIDFFSKSDPAHMITEAVMSALGRAGRWSNLIGTRGGMVASADTGIEP